MATKTAKRKTVKRGQCGPLPPRNDPPQVTNCLPVEAAIIPLRWSMRCVPHATPISTNDHAWHVYDGNEHVGTFRYQKFAAAFVAVMNAAGQ